MTGVSGEEARRSARSKRSRLSQHRSAGFIWVNTAGAGARLYVDARDGIEDAQQVVKIRPRLAPGFEDPRLSQGDGGKKRRRTPICDDQGDRSVNGDALAPCVRAPG